VDARIKSGHDAVVGMMSRRDQSEASDEETLVAALRRLAPSVKRSKDRAWSREPAVRVIDCVLSLNRPYDRFVVPRLDRFEARYPAVRSVADLAAMIRSCPSPHAFVREALDYNHEARAETLAAVVDWLLARCGGRDSPQKLQHWAAQARPSDLRDVNIRGFGLSGFQYLRLLFGADTVQPDIHLARRMAEWLGHPVSAMRALELLEAAAPKAGLRLRDLDAAVWNSGARGEA
jgi:hypothetical protein